MQKQNAFVESGQATDIYLLQENGIGIAENQQEITPFQRQVLICEKARQQREERKQLEQQEGGSSPSGLNHVRGKRKNAKSDKIQAIKNSQEEKNKFINKKVVDKE